MGFTVVVHFSSPPPQFGVSKFFPPVAAPVKGKRASVVSQTAGGGTKVNDHGNSEKTSFYSLKKAFLENFSKKN